jgi:FkbM family methyltransferase
LKFFKNILLRILGQKKYLAFVSKVFYTLYFTKLLKNNKSYANHYFVKHFVHAGNTVLDIGGNLGYFTKIFAKLTGPAGNVYTVEPIELYRNILAKNVAEYKHVTILPYALGTTEAVIKMGNPAATKYRHGLMRVLSPSELNIDGYNVQMKNPATLFADIPTIHFIKCDIEGYKVPVIPAMKN